MVTLDENELATEELVEVTLEDEDVDSKVASLKEALSHGEIPEDLKEFISSMQEKKESSESDALDQDIEHEEEDVLEDEEKDDDDDIIDDSIDNMNDMDPSDSSLDDLNDLF